MGEEVVTVRRVETAEAGELSAVLARVFENDPMAMHLLPDGASRLPRLNRAFRMVLERIYLPQQECYTLSPILGGAVWLPPGKYPPPVWQMLRLLPRVPPIFGLSRVPRALRDLNQMEKMHPKVTPHWYLAFLGVAPSEQRKGLGSALIRPVLEKCDAENTPAYVENSHEQNLPFYLRHGFEVITECDIHQGPHLWGMWRTPKA